MVETKWERRIEDIILIYFIVTKLLQFFGLIDILSVFGIYPDMIDFIDIIVSFTGLGYVLYRASLTDIFFGERNKKLDLILLIFYFLLITNKFTEFSSMLVSQSTCLSSTPVHFLVPFFCFLTLEANSIEQIAFYLGTMGLLLISIYVTFKVNIKEPSILNALHEDNKTKKLKKFLTTYLVSVGFYLIFFNLIMEWFTRVLDAPFVMIAIFVYVFKIHDIGKSMGTEDTLFKISDIVENITEKFISLFHNKRTIFLGISAMLVLHLVSDFGGFVLPYNMGVESFYKFEDELHRPFREVYLHDKTLLTEKGTQVLAIMGYLINSIGTFFLMLFPGFIWAIVYLNHVSERKKSLVFPTVLVALFFSSFIYMIFLPTYRITSMGTNSTVKNLLGVDIQTQSILTTGNSISIFFIISVVVFLMILLMSRIDLVKDILFFIMTLISLGFFGIYIYYFFHSVFWFYLETLGILFSQSSIYVGMVYLIFLMITVMFYIGGYLSFVISAFKEEPSKK